MRVLELGAEGAGFELDATLDEHGAVRAFYAWTGGAHGFEDLFDEAPEPRVAHGPLSWETVLEKWLRPHAWLKSYPVLVHSAIADRVSTELSTAPEATRARWRPTLQAAQFRGEILRAYAGDNCIHPYIGEAFASGHPDALRVMTVGINAYVSPEDWAKQSPQWYAEWFREGRHRFDRGVFAGASVLASSIAKQSQFFRRLAFRGRENIFHTNAVKAYLPEAQSKRAHELTHADFERHEATWHAELDIMAKYRVLPHVVLVFGRPAWEWVWKAFHPDTGKRFEHFAVRAFTTGAGEAQHFANRIDIALAGEDEHTLVLIQVRHPAARATSKATPEWLLSCAEVRDVAGLPPIAV